MKMSQLVIIIAHVMSYQFCMFTGSCAVSQSGSYRNMTLILKSVITLMHILFLITVLFHIVRIIGAPEMLAKCRFRKCEVNN